MQDKVEQLTLCPTVSQAPLAQGSMRAFSSSHPTNLGVRLWQKLEYLDVFLTHLYSMDKIEQDGKQLLLIASTFGALRIRTASLDANRSGRYRFQKSTQLRRVKGQKFRQAEPQRTSFRGFIFHPSLQNIIYDSTTATSCWWCHTWRFTSFLPPQFQLQGILHCSERQENVKKHVL